MYPSKVLDHLLNMPFIRVTLAVGFLYPSRDI